MYNSERNQCSENFSSNYINSNEIKVLKVKRDKTRKISCYPKIPCYNNQDVLVKLCLEHYLNKRGAMSYLYNLQNRTGEVRESEKNVTIKSFKHTGMTSRRMPVTKTENIIYPYRVLHQQDLEKNIEDIEKEKSIKKVSTSYFHLEPDEKSNTYNAWLDTSLLQV